MKTGLDDLTDDVAELIAPHIAESAETLAAIGEAIAKRRDDAKTARASSGIETIWKECEEAYIGIDDANRQEFQDARWAKPMSMDGPITTGKTQKQPEYKSTAFVRLTARYVDAGSAKLGEILLPADDKAFSFSETPVPELIKAKQDTSQVVHSDLGVPLMRPAQPGEPVPGPPQAPTAAPVPGGAVPVAGAVGVPPVPPPAGPAAPPSPGAPAPAPAPAQVPLTVKDLAEENIEIARKAAKAAETRIYGWMVDCQHAAEMRKVIDDAARIGVGVLKGPIPVVKKSLAVEKVNGKPKVIVREKTSPATRWCDPWNIFPDPACGENIHNGDWIFDRDFLSARQVRDLRNVPGYISAQIDQVLIEGPENSNKDNDAGAGGSPSAAMAKGRFTVWYYYGSLKREEMGTIWAAAGKNLAELPPDKAEVYAIVTLINERVVRATINPLDSGSFPYHSVPWQRRAGHWAGIGVAEQIKMPQKMINASTRGMLNNAGKSAGTQIVVDQGSIKPADGNWVLTPDKIWYKTADSGSDNVNETFAIHEIPNVTPQLMTINEYALKLAEESTSIPLITQGQSGDTQPETLGATNIQNNNANQLLRSIGYSFDDHITEPVVRQYYEWLLLDPDVPDEEKGEFTVNAHGSAALVERAIQDQTIAQMGTTVTNPIFGIDPKKWMIQFIKSKRLDPDDFQYTPEQQAKIDSTPPPDAPAVAVAKIAAQTAATQIAAKQTAEQQSVQSEEKIAQAAAILDGAKVQNDAARVQAEQQRTLAENSVKLHALHMEHERAVLQYALQHQMKLEDVKTSLAKTSMTLDMQRELNATDNLVDLHKSKHGAHPQHSTPPLERVPDQVPGRAGNGRSFEQSPSP